MTSMYSATGVSRWKLGHKAMPMDGLERLPAILRVGSR